MINAKLTFDLERFTTNFAGQLARLRAAAWPIILLTALSCSKDPIPTVCLTGDCEGSMEFPVTLDENGYYHVPLDWNQEYYPYFAIEAVATTTSPEYRYNGDPVVTARFDSDTTWVIGDTLVMQQAYYKPFSSLWTSTAGPLPSYIGSVNLTQFKGTVVHIAQPTHIYLTGKGEKVRSKRILGPFPPHMKGDTIQVFMELIWDAGMESITKSNFSEKFIVE